MKPGDRVRITAEGEWFGDTGTIVGSVSSPLYDWAVDVDGDPMSVRAFAADDLQVLS